jgi:SAM-dependent methyltransferase
MGPMPMANSFLSGPEQFADEPSYPLDLYFCETCSLVQLLDVIDPELLFRNYIYVTGTSDTMAGHNRRYASTIVDLLKLQTDALVVEVASNDGSLLKCFQEHGVRTLGIEPATNIAQIARSRGVETIEHFFSLATARQVLREHGSADVIIANNVLAHVDETLDFLTGCKELLKPEGVLVVEVPYLGELIDRLEYDTVYHEHLCYFSLTSLLRLCDEAGLSVFRIDRMPVHGGTIRVYSRARDRYPEHAGNVLKAVAAEVQAGLTTLARYERFAKDVEKSARTIRNLLIDLKERGKTVAGYGAPAKGNTLLNYSGIGVELLPYIVDKNPRKVNLYTPGMHIPVLPTSVLLQKQPDYLFILAWNFTEEIMKQQREYREHGGQFIVPLPEPKVVPPCKS